MSNETSRMKRKVYRVGEIPADLVDAIRASEPPAEAEVFNGEYPPELDAIRLAALRQAIAVGDADSAAGRTVDHEAGELARRLTRHLQDH